MLKFPEETENVIKPLVPDYPINLVEVRRISKEIRQKMTSDFALIAEYVARKKDAERLEELMSDNEHIIKHPEEFLDLLSEVANDEQYKSAREKLQNEEKENVTMCVIADKLVSKGIEQGIEQVFLNLSVEALNRKICELV